MTDTYSITGDVGSHPSITINGNTVEYNAIRFVYSKCFPEDMIFTLWKDDVGHFEKGVWVYEK